MRASRDAGDEGSTLIETLVALAVVMTVMSAMGPFFINSLLIVAQQRTNQTAAQLADGAIAQIRALKGSSLVTDRGFLKTDRQWCAVPFPAAGGALSQLPSGVTARGATCPANAATPYLVSMQEVWDPQVTDPASTLGDDAAISTATQTMAIDNTTFARTIYVGACDIYTTSTSGNCVNSTVFAPPSDSSTDLKFFRAVVLITWPARTCPAGTCSYVTSTLLSRASEPTFDFHRPSPLVTTKSATFYRNTATAFSLKASGGQLPNTWTATPLPVGLTVTPAGVLSGTPTTLGTTVSTVRVADTLGRSDTETVTLNVVAPLVLTVPANPVGHVGDAVSQAAVATGGVAPYTYSSSALPPGLSLNTSTGAITGTLTTAGSFGPITVTVADSNTTVGVAAPMSVSYTQVVWPAVALAAIPAQSVNLGSPVSVTAAGSGGDGSLTYSATGLPLGVAINASTGVISGPPVVPGRYLPTVTVTDGSGGTASARFALVVNSSTVLNFTSPPLSAPDQSSTVGTLVSVTLSNNGGLLGLLPTLAVTGLPPGLTLNVLTGVVSGRPTTAGTYTVTAIATSLLPPQISNLTFLWTVT